jgi:hypothetical protein
MLCQVLIITLNKICVHEIVKTVFKKLATLHPFTITVYRDLNNRQGKNKVKSLL